MSVSAVELHLIDLDDLPNYAELRQLKGRRIGWTCLPFCRSTAVAAQMLYNISELWTLEDDGNRHRGLLRQWLIFDGGWWKVAEFPVCSSFDPSAAFQMVYKIKLAHRTTTDKVAVYTSSSRTKRHLSALGVVLPSIEKQ